MATCDVTAFRPVYEGFGYSAVASSAWNQSTSQLVAEAVQRGEGQLAEDGALIVATGSCTGRSPLDRFIVDCPDTHDSVDWGSVNRAMSRADFDRLEVRMRRHLGSSRPFVQELHAGSDPRYRLRLRLFTENAWHALFARNMFLRPRAEDLPGFVPDVTVLHAPGLLAGGPSDGVRSERFIALDLARRIVLIGGTSYAGEIKKAVFTILNHYLPDHGVLPMHCSANIGDRGDVAVYFGLSGTGKTTLSADANRRLVGDDEHGWSNEGIFNFEGGCYAKVIGLDPRSEPEIYRASNGFGTILENVVLDPVSGRPDFADASLAENTRSSYPLHFIDRIAEGGRGGHPSNIVMLTADAFGVLPPISQLTPEQAVYHFLSGYTARVAGTEAGVFEPQATFSACFGAPFMPRHPCVYAGLLRDLMRRHGVSCWLINTGWTGGGYGVGRRIDLAATRAMLRAALAGDLARIPTSPDPQFGLHVPRSCPQVPSEMLDAKSLWNNPAAYESQARELASRFEANFETYAARVDSEVISAGIHAAA